MFHLRLIISVIALVSIIGLAACQPAPSSDLETPDLVTPTHRPPPTEQPTATKFPTGEAIGECFRSYTVEVYVDQNLNGVRDANEAPAQGVNVGVFVNTKPPQLLSSADTGFDGSAQLGFISTGDCESPDILLGVLAMPGIYDVPTGYTFAKVKDITFGGTGSVSIGLISSGTPTPPPTVLPTRAPTPDFDPCEALSRDQIESLIGRLTAEPEFSASVGEEVGYFVSCTYQSATNFVNVTYTYFATAEATRNQLGEADQEGRESVDGLGDAAFWDETNMTICAANDVLYVCIYGLPRKEAIEAMEMILVRIPVK